MPVTADALKDLIRTTLEDLPQGQFEMMWDSQNYIFPRIYQEKRRLVDGGTSITRNVILDRHGRARYRRMYDTDKPVVDQNHKTINVPWTQFTTDYSWDELELMRNRNSTKGFISLIESRRAERLWDLAELMEERGWSTPSNATDNLFPYGVPYYLNFADSGVSDAGFVGQTIRYTDNTTGTICAGIDAAAEPKWRNYVGFYDAIDNSLLRTLRQAVRKTKFNPPAFVLKPGDDSYNEAMMGAFTDGDTINEIEDLLEKRDDSTTPADTQGKIGYNNDGAVTINKVPLVYVPQLDGVEIQDGGSNAFQPKPIYCVDFSKFQPIVQDGYWMRQSEPLTDRGQHTTFTVFLDACHQNLCTNRRTTGFVIHKPIPAA